MKKILIFILIILLLTFTYFTFSKGMSLGKMKINSVKDIKNENIKLDESFNKANELVNVRYRSEVDNLENAIKQLKVAKQEYESKNIYQGENSTIKPVQLKTYTIHYLWTIIGNYRKDRGIQTLNLDLKSTSVKDVYNLEFTIQGNYIGITDFIYDLENDTELNFEIKKLNIYSGVSSLATNTNPSQGTSGNNSANNNVNTNTTNTGNTTTVSEDGTIIQATFTVEDVGITLE